MKNNKLFSVKKILAFWVLLALMSAPASLTAKELTDEQNARNEEILDECYSVIYPETGRSKATVKFQPSPLLMNMCKKRKGYIFSRDEERAEILRNCFYEIDKLTEPRNWSDDLFMAYSPLIVICMDENGYSGNTQEVDDE